MSKSPHDPWPDERSSPDIDSEPRRRWRPKPELLRALQDARKDLRPGESSLFWDWTATRDSAPEALSIPPSGDGEFLVCFQEAAAAYSPPVKVAPAATPRPSTRSRIRVREDLDPRRQPTVKNPRLQRLKAANVRQSPPSGAVCALLSTPAEMPPMQADNGVDSERIRSYIRYRSTQATASNSVSERTPIAGAWPQNTHGGPPQLHCNQSCLPSDALASRPLRIEPRQLVWAGLVAAAAAGAVATALHFVLHQEPPPQAPPEPQAVEPAKITRAEPQAAQSTAAQATVKAPEVAPAPPPAGAQSGAQRTLPSDPRRKAKSVKIAPEAASPEQKKPPHSSEPKANEPEPPGAGFLIRKKGHEGR